MLACLSIPMVRRYDVSVHTCKPSFEGCMTVPALTENHLRHARHQ